MFAFNSMHRTPRHTPNLLRLLNMLPQNMNPQNTRQRNLRQRNMKPQNLRLRPPHRWRLRHTRNRRLRPRPISMQTRSRPARR